MPGYHAITIGEASPVVKRYELVSKCRHENKHYLQFSTTISSTESTSYLFVHFCVWFSCVSFCLPTPLGLLILPSRVWTLVSCNISTVCFSQIFSEFNSALSFSMACYTDALFSTVVNELSTVNRAWRDYWTPLSCTPSPSEHIIKHKALVLFYPQ